MSSLLKSLNTKMISMLTVDVKTRKLTGVNRETMKEAIMSLKIPANVLHRSRAMWDILLASEDAVKSLTCSIMTTKLMRLQTDYDRIRKTKVILYGVPLILLDHLVFFVSKFGQIARIFTVRIKSWIATGIWTSRIEEILRYKRNSHQVLV